MSTSMSAGSAPAQNGPQEDGDHHKLWAGDNSGETHICRGVFTQWLEKYADHSTLQQCASHHCGHYNTQSVATSAEYSKLRISQFAHLPQW